MQNRLLTAFLLAAVALAPGLARAADPTEKTFEAHALTDKAAALYDEGVVAFRKSKWAEARASFLAAWALKQHWQIAANLADCELQLGRFREAAEHATYYAKNAPADRGERAVKLLADASTKIATLAIDAQPEGAEILVDGQPIGRAPLGGPVFLEPGERTITARVPGRPDVVRKLALIAGRADKVQLQVDEAKVPVVALPPPPPPPPPPRSVVPGVVIAGVGVAALATGIGLLVSAKAKGSSAETTNHAILTAGHSCVAGAPNYDGQCETLLSTATAARTSNHVGVGFLAGAGAAAVGTALYFLWPASKDTVPSTHGLHVVPSASDTGAGLIFSGAF